MIASAGVIVCGYVYKPRAGGRGVWFQSPLNEIRRDHHRVNLAPPIITRAIVGVTPIFYETPLLRSTLPGMLPKKWPKKQ